MPSGPSGLALGVFVSVAPRLKPKAASAGLTRGAQRVAVFSGLAQDGHARPRASSARRRCCSRATALHEPTSGQAVGWGSRAREGVVRVVGLFAIPPLAPSLRPHPQVGCAVPRTVRTPPHGAPSHPAYPLACFGLRQDTTGDRVDHQHASATLPSKTTTTRDEERYFGSLVHVLAAPVDPVASIGVGNDRGAPHVPPVAEPFVPRARAVLMSAWRDGITRWRGQHCADALVTGRLVCHTDAAARV